MSLYTKAINYIGIEDVISFCNQSNEEGIRLEYKRDFSGKDANRQIAKELASFANTYGGILLIGIDEKDRKPVMPIVGIPNQEGIDEKINSIALKAINPPVFPEIKVCFLNESSQNVVIVVRVHESNETPHRIEQDTKVYIRVASQNEPVLAPFEEIEWLINRREKAVANRKWLLKRAHIRFSNKYQQPRNQDTKVFTTPQPSEEYVLPPKREISVIPLYPDRHLFDFHNLEAIVEKAMVKTNNFTFDFPRRLREPLSLQDSLIFSSDEKYGELQLPYIKHSEINTFGLVFHKESLIEDTLKELSNAIHLNFILQRIYFPILFAKRFYEEVGYWGICQININFNHIRGRRLSTKGMPYFDDFPINAYDDSIHMEKEIPAWMLTETIDDICISFYKEILWSSGGKRFASRDAFLAKSLETMKSEIGILE